MNVARMNAGVQCFRVPHNATIANIRVKFGLVVSLSQDSFISIWWQRRVDVQSAMIHLNVSSEVASAITVWSLVVHQFSNLCTSTSPLMLQKTRCFWASTEAYFMLELCARLFHVNGKCVHNNAKINNKHDGK